MGLSGNTRKTKIPDDPRNTKWANDVSAPGFRLLSSMGWTPSAPSLGLASSQSLISAGGSTSFSKKISVIPIAKDDNLGIGARRGAGSAGMRAMGVPMLLGGATGMGFVTAAPVIVDEAGIVVPATAAVVQGGGEFGRLLERLNAANSARNSPAPSDADTDDMTVPANGGKEGTKEERKAKRQEKRESKRKRSEEDDGSVVAASISAAVDVPVVIAVAAPIVAKVLVNPRMAARSKHLRAKRMATSSNAAAMAEILGIAPSPSPTPSTHSPHSPASFSPAPASPSITPAVFVSHDVRGENGWPTAPARAFPVFASSSSTGLAATFVQAATVASTAPPTTVDPVDAETEKQKLKREKAERKDSRQQKRDRKLEKQSEAVVATSTVVSGFPAFTPSSTRTLAATFVVEEAAVGVEAVPDEAAARSEGKDKKDRPKKLKREAGGVDASADAAASVAEDAVERTSKKAKKEKTKT